MVVTKRAALLAVVGAVLSFSAARAEVVVAAGHSVGLMTLSSVEPTCQARGDVAVTVVEQPRGGFIQITRTKTFPNFSTLNTRARCNTLKLPATRVIYQSAGNFLGMDYVTVEAIFPDGGVKRIRVAISVRAIAPGVAPVLRSSDDQIGAPAPRRPRVRHAEVHAAQPAHSRCGAACAAKSTRPTKPAEAKPLLTPI